MEGVCIKVLYGSPITIYIYVKYIQVHNKVCRHAVDFLKCHFLRNSIYLHCIRVVAQVSDISQF